MSKRKHKFRVTSFADLAAAYPLAVTEETVVKQKANYSYVAKLLDCELPVPGSKWKERRLNSILLKKENNHGSLSEPT